MEKKESRRITEQERQSGAINTSFEVCLQKITSQRLGWLLCQDDMKTLAQWQLIK